jgi:hypothetical protein
MRPREFQPNQALNGHPDAGRLRDDRHQGCGLAAYLRFHWHPSAI